MIAVEQMLRKYFKNLYKRAMDEAYSLAHQEIINALDGGGKCLDCGASQGHKFDQLNELMRLESERYYGIEWSERRVTRAREKGLNIFQGDLNEKISFPGNHFRCIFGLSVIEHLLNPCFFLKECHRVLKKGGSLVILTPNISTYFTAILILLGKMPSSGPHPDSDELIKQEEIFKVSKSSIQPDTEIDTPAHRHLVVFSYRVLFRYMKLIGFRDIRGYGFGLYPFPNSLQPFLERIDPYHCHQLVFVAKK